jgi:hypothetical protein
MPPGSQSAEFPKTLDVSGGCTVQKRALLPNISCIALIEDLAREFSTTYCGRTPHNHNFSTFFHKSQEKTGFFT